MLFILMAAVPLLLSVTDCAAVVEPITVAAKVRLAGVTFAFAAVPVPESVTVCGLLPAESMNVNVAERVPVAAGVKVMLTEQLLELARLAPQVLAEIPKSEAFAPEMAILLIAMVLAPPLLSITDCAAVVEPTVVTANARLDGATVTVVVPVPLRATD